MGLGIGIGHFIGWSEKLELQEMYAEERETKMEELTDSLVSLSAPSFRKDVNVPLYTTLV